MTRRAGAVVPWALVVVLGAFVVLCVAWRVDGGRWERVESPSMGTVAPVGTLLWVHPVDFDRLHRGDFITFHPPGRADETYSHQVYRRNADGSLTTKGVIPGPDPWRLRARDVVGQVRMRWPGVGWLVRAAPVLLLGGALVAGVRRLLRIRWRLPATIVLGSLVLTVAISWLRPFVDAEQLSFVAARDGGADATYVGTGLLPIRLQAHHGAQVVLRDGQVGTVHVPRADRDDRLRVRLSPAVPPWWWAVMVLACFLPALQALLAGPRPATGEPAPRRRHARN